MHTIGYVFPEKCSIGNPIFLGHPGNFSQEIHTLLYAPFIVRTKNVYYCKHRGNTISWYFLGHVWVQFSSQSLYWAMKCPKKLSWYFLSVYVQINLSQYVLIWNTLQKWKMVKLMQLKYSHHNRYTVGNYITITSHPHHKIQKCDKNKDKGCHKNIFHNQITFVIHPIITRITSIGVLDQSQVGFGWSDNPKNN